MIEKRYCCMGSDKIRDKQTGDDYHYGYEIEQLVNKQYEKNQRLIKMLNNVANYMQKEHKDMPIDDFVEWFNNIATGGLE